MSNDNKQVIEFAGRVARAMDKLRSSTVFFILQQAYPEDADTWEWSDFQSLLNEVIEKTKDCLPESSAGKPQ